MAKIPLRAYTNEIETIIEQQQTEEAIAHCRHILQVYPKHIDTYRLLGKAYLESRRYGNAADIFERVLSAIPYDFVSHVGMSITREDDGNFDDAIWHMERAFEGQPYNAAIQGELRRLYGKRDGMEPPKIYLTRAALARMYAKGNLFQQAIAELRAAIAEDPNRLDLKVFLAKMYLQIGETAKAIESCGTIIKKLPYCLDANLMLVQLLATSSRTNESEVYRKRLQELDPYQAHLNPNAPDRDHVQDQAVLIDQLIWDGGSAMVSADQPEWAATVGVTLGDSGAGQEDLPEWIDDSSGEHTNLPVAINEDGVDPEEEELIPDFMKDAGWEPSTGAFDESKSVIDINDETDEIEFAAEAIEADLPDWLQPMAPSDEKESVYGDLPDMAQESDAVDATAETIDIFGDDESLEEIPDWLSDMDIEPASELGSAELPDWLQEAEESANLISEDSEDSDLPDWLAPAIIGTAVADILDNKNDEDITPSEEFTPSIEKELTTEDAEIPDWLQDVTEGQDEIELLSEGIPDIAKDSEIPDGLQDVVKDEEPVAAIAVEPAQTEEVENVNNQDDVVEEREPELEEPTSIVAADVPEPIVEKVSDDGENADLPEWIKEAESEQHPEQIEDGKLPDFNMDTVEEQERLETVDGSIPDLADELELPELILDVTEEEQMASDDEEPVSAEILEEVDIQKDIIEEPYAEPEELTPSWVTDIPELPDSEDKSPLEGDDADLPDWLAPAAVGTAGIIGAAAIEDILNGKDDEESIISGEEESTTSNLPDSLSKVENGQDSNQKVDIEIPDWIQHEMEESDEPEEGDEDLAEEADLPSWLKDAVEEHESDHIIESPPVEGVVIEPVSEVEQPFSEEKADLVKEESPVEIVSLDGDDAEFSDGLTPTAGFASIDDASVIEDILINDKDDESSAQIQSTTDDIVESIEPTIASELESFPEQEVEIPDWIQSSVEDKDLSDVTEDESDFIEEGIESKLIDDAVLAYTEDSEVKDLFEMGEADTEPDQTDKTVIPDWIQEVVESEEGSQKPTEKEEPITDEGDSVPPIDFDDPDSAMAWLENLAAKQGVSEEELLTSPEDRSESPPDWVLDIADGESLGSEPEPQLPASESVADGTEESEANDWILESDLGSEDQKVDYSSEGVLPDVLVDVPVEPEALARVDNVIPSEIDDIPEWMQTTSDEIPSIGEGESAPQIQPEDKLDDIPEWIQDIAKDESPEELDIPDETLASKEPVQSDLDESEVSFTWLEDLDLQQEAIVEEIQTSSELEPDEVQVEHPDPALELPEFLQDTASVSAIAESTMDTEGPSSIPEVSDEPDFDDVDAAMAWLESLAAKQGVSEDELLSSPEERSETPPDWVQESSQAEHLVDPDIDSLIADVPEDTPYAESENVVETGEDYTADTVEQLVDEPEKDTDTEFGDVDAAMAWLESLAAKQGVSEDELLTSPEERSETPPDWVQESVDTDLITTTLPSPEEDSSEKVEQPFEIPASHALSEETLLPQGEDISYAPPSWVTDGQVPEDEDLSWLPTEDGEDETQLLDLNQASLIQLERLPGIGFRRAQSITAYREEHGDFTSLDSLLNVPGMDHDTLELLKMKVALFTSAQELENEAIQQADLFDQQDVEPDDTVHELQLAAQAKLNENNISEAMEDYQQIINKDQRIHAVIADLVRASEKYPDEVSVAQTLGDAYMKANKLQEALEAYTKAQNLLE